MKLIVDDESDSFLHFFLHSLLASQCTPVSRLVSGLPLAELQSHLPEVPKSSESPSPGESSLTQSLQVASSLVSRFSSEVHVSGTLKLSNVNDCSKLVEKRFFQ